MKRTTATFGIALFAALATASTGCGYSEDEWQAQLAKYDQLNAQYEQEKKAHAEARALLDNEMKHVADLSAQLKNMGVNLDSLNEQLHQTGTEKEQMAAVQNRDRQKV